MNLDEVLDIHVGIAHTRWATHGAPSPINSHPQRSDEENEFVVVHNGIITNYKDIKQFLIKKGFVFESETDTEVIAKLMKHVHDTLPNLSFRELVEQVIQQLEGKKADLLGWEISRFTSSPSFSGLGAFALVMKSNHYPGQCVATRRGSPLLVGIKSKSNLCCDYIPVIFSSKGMYVLPPLPFS